VEVEFNLTLEDIQAFVRYYQRSRPGQKFRLGRNWVWVVLLCLLLLMMVAGNSLRELLPGLLVGGVLGALGVLFILVRSNKVLLQSQDEFCSEPHNQWVFSARRVTLSPEELVIASWFFRTSYRWQAIWDIGVTPAHVFLFTTSREAVPVPRRAFRDQQHFEEFVALARHYQQGAPTSTAITAAPPRPTTITRAPE
jgi:hypothetical protein